jgi:hypothetical protein
MNDVPTVRGGELKECHNPLEKCEQIFPERTLVSTQPTKAPLLFSAFLS